MFTKGFSTENIVFKHANCLLQWRVSPGLVTICQTDGCPFITCQILHCAIRQKVESVDSSRSFWSLLYPHVRAPQRFPSLPVITGFHSLWDAEWHNRKGYTKFRFNSPSVHSVDQRFWQRKYRELLREKLLLNPRGHCCKNHPIRELPILLLCGWCWGEVRGWGTCGSVWILDQFVLNILARLLRLMGTVVFRAITHDL